MMPHCEAEAKNRKAGHLIRLFAATKNKSPFMQFNIGFYIARRSFTVCVRVRHMVFRLLPAGIR